MITTYIAFVDRHLVIRLYESGISAIALRTLDGRMPI